MTTLSLPLSLLITLLLTSFFCLALQPLALRLGLVDEPDARKRHHGPVPLIGGMAMILGFAFSLMLLDMPLTPWRALFVGMGVLLLVGLFDDAHEISPGSRFMAQIGVALLMALWGQVYLDNLGDLCGLGSIALGWLAVPVTVFAAVGVMNAVNLSDGMDGLAGSLSLVSLGALALVAWQAGATAPLALLLLLLTSILGFLLFNLRTPWLPRARIFMGDSGSLVLGFAIAWFAIALTQGEQRVLAPVTVLWLCAVPLLDTVVSLLRRALKGRSLMQPDCGHLHHILLAAGFSVSQTLAVMVGFALMAALFGLYGHYAAWPESLMFLLFLLLFGGVFGVIRRAWRVKCLLGRTLAHGDLHG
jgi:UDP-GlcNAc:undecaprenyl-phosphate GlcNAc-1-phosphate transferase